MYTGHDIRNKRKSLGLSAEALADKLGVNKNNLYKWEKGHKPHDPEDFIKVQKWLAGEVETVTQSKKPPEPQQGDKSELLDIMRERIADLKQDKEWLKKNLEFSLTGIMVGNKSILAHVATMLEKDIEREAGGNKKKEQLLKEDSDKRIGDKLSGFQQTDNSLNR